MSSPFPDHIANAILDLLFGPSVAGQTVGGFIVPTHWYAALLTTLPPDNTVTGATLVEPTGGEYAAYARKSIANTAAEFAAAALRVKSNVHDIVWPNFAAGTGCSVLGVGFVDTAAGAGNVGWWSALPAPRAITADGTPPTCAAGLILIGVAP